MPRTWSNVKYKETRSAAQRVKDRPSSVTLYIILLGLCVLIFNGLIVYTMNTVIRHPITEIKAPLQPPKED